MLLPAFTFNRPVPLWFSWPLLRHPNPLSVCAWVWVWKALQPLHLFAFFYLFIVCPVKAVSERNVGILVPKAGIVDSAVLTYYSLLLPADAYYLKPFEGNWWMNEENMWSMTVEKKTKSLTLTNCCLINATACFIGLFFVRFMLIIMVRRRKNEDCVLSVPDYIKVLGAHCWWWILPKALNEGWKTMAICESVQLIVG